MERNKQIQIGLLALVGLLLIANLFGGGIKNWFGQGEGDQIREQAAAMTGSNTTTAANSPSSQGTGNIPGTNVNATATPSGPLTSLQFEETTYDFGVKDEGTIVKHVFKFKNTGDAPLVIANAKGSCGCTVPTWPKQPVPPGGSGEISVEFNTKGKPGRQSKQVTVTANTNPTDSHLEIAGEVRPKAQPVSKGN